MHSRQVQTGLGSAVSNSSLHLPRAWISRFAAAFQAGFPMNNLVGKLAILFAGVIVALVFLNIYLLTVTIMILPALISLQFNFGVNAPQELSALLYWICLAAGAITSFFVM